MLDSLVHSEPQCPPPPPGHCTYTRQGYSQYMGWVLSPWQSRWGKVPWLLRVLGSCEEPGASCFNSLVPKHYSSMSTVFVLWNFPFYRNSLPPGSALGYVLSGPTAQAVPLYLLGISCSRRWRSAWRTAHLRKHHSAPWH